MQWAFCGWDREAFYRISDSITLNTISSLDRPNAREEAAHPGAQPVNRLPKIGTCKMKFPHKMPQDKDESSHHADISRRPRRWYVSEKVLRSRKTPPVLTAPVERRPTKRLVTTTVCQWLCMPWPAVVYAMTEELTASGRDPLYNSWY